MEYPPFVRFSDSEDYRKHFEAVYCQGPLRTFDGIDVRFRKSDFDHAFFESAHRDGVKDTFSTVRAERIDWIKTALEDPDSERYQGWDKNKRQHTRKRRVAIVMRNYVVIIMLTSDSAADFLTAFVDRGTRIPGRPRTIDEIQNAPKWE